MARRPLVRDVTRMHVSTAAFQRYDKEQGGFLPGINPAVLRATDAMLHDVSNAARSISDEYGMINRGEKTMYTADDFSGAVPVYAGTAEKDFYVPREFEDNLRAVMEHVNDKWDSNRLTPSVGNVGFNPQYTHEKLVGRTKVYRSQAAMRKAMQEILRRGGMTESAATAKNPYRLTEWLPMPETDYNAAMAAGTLSQATSRLFKGATPDADRMSRIVATNEHKKEAERRQAEQEKQQKEQERQQKAQEREQDRQAKAQERQQRIRENAEAQAARQKQLEEKKEASESERAKRRALVRLTAMATLTVTLLRRIAQSISELAAAGTATVTERTDALSGVSLETPLGDSIADQILKWIDPLKLISPLIKSAQQKVDEVYEQKQTEAWTGIDVNKQRWYNMIDQAHGLNKGTFVAGVAGLEKAFADVRDLDSRETEINRTAPLLSGALVKDIINMSVVNSGVDAAATAEKVLNEYFMQYQKGLDALGNEETDPSKRMRSLVYNLNALSPELADILRQMISDSQPGSLYGGYSDYEGWAFATKAAQLYTTGTIGLTESEQNVSMQLKQQQTAFEAALSAVFDKNILNQFLPILLSLQEWVQRIAYKLFMTDEQRAAWDTQERAKLREKQPEVEARRTKAFSAVAAAFGMSEKEFTDKYLWTYDNITGHEKELSLSEVLELGASGVAAKGALSKLFASGGVSTEAMKAVAEYMVAMGFSGQMEKELESSTPMYSETRWTKDYYNLMVESAVKSLALSLGKARPNAGVLDAYMSLSTVTPFIDAVDNFAGMSSAKWAQERNNFTAQLDFIDEFIAWGAEKYGDRLWFGTGEGDEKLSFSMLRDSSKYRDIDANDTTVLGVQKLKGMLANMPQELIDEVMLGALTNILRGESHMKFGTMRSAYEDTANKALAMFQRGVAEGTYGIEAPASSVDVSAFGASSSLLQAGSHTLNTGVAETDIAQLVSMIDEGLLREVSSSGVGMPVEVLLEALYNKITRDTDYTLGNTGRMDVSRSGADVNIRFTVLDKSGNEVGWAEWRGSDGRASSTSTEAGDLTITGKTRTFNK